MRQPRITEDPSALGDPTGRTVAPSEEESREAAHEGTEDDDEQRQRSRPYRRGARVELGYSFYQLETGYGPGPVHAVFFGGFLPFGRFRAEASAEFGTRAYSLGKSDIVARGTLLAGYQHLGTSRFIPYGGVIGTLGIVFGTRFRTSLSETLAGAGLEVGSDVRLFRKLLLGCGFSYLRAGLGGTGYDVFGIRLRIGL